MGPIRVLDARTGIVTGTLKGQTAVFSPDGSRIATLSWTNHSARIYTANRGQQLFVWSWLGDAPDEDGLTDVAWSPDGARIAFSDGRTVRVYDANTGDPVATLKGHTRVVTFVRFSPDGRRVLTGSNDCTARVWDAGSGAELLTLKGHTEEIVAGAWSPDGSNVATGSGDKTARVWDARPIDPQLLPKFPYPAVAPLPGARGR